MNNSLCNYCEFEKYKEVCIDREPRIKTTNKITYINNKKFRDCFYFRKRNNVKIIRKVCKEMGCFLPHYVNGYCRKHYETEKELEKEILKRI